MAAPVWRIESVTHAYDVPQREARPTSDSERLDILDAMRGFALGGIFLLNLAAFSGFVFMTPEMMASLPTAAFDMPAAGLILWLGYGKFYSLFSLLFGIGFSLQLAAAEHRGDSRLAVFRRRLLVLLAIGAVHLYIWEGDILFLYALVGFLLIPFRRVRDTTLLRAAVALVLAPVALEALIVVEPRGTRSWCAAAARGRRSARDDRIFAGDAALSHLCATPGGPSFCGSSSAECSSGMRIC